MMTSTLNGELFYIFAVAIVDAAVLHGLRCAGTGAPFRAPWARPERTPFRRPRRQREGRRPRARRWTVRSRFAVFNAGGAPSRKSARRAWPAGWRRVAIAYCAGAALFSAVVTAAGAVEASVFRLSALFGMWFSGS